MIFLKEVKLRALHVRRKLKDEVADLLRAGLAAVNRPAATTRRLKSPRVKIDRKTGLPAIICAANARASRMTARQLIALEQQYPSRGKS